MKNRSSAYRRYKNQVVIRRKKRIIHENGDYWNFRYEHCLSKNKIHCSCWLCRHKSYDQSRMDDTRRALTMLADIKEARLANTRAERVIRNRINRRSLR